MNKTISLFIYFSVFYLFIHDVTAIPAIFSHHFFSFFNSFGVMVLAFLSFSPLLIVKIRSRLAPKTFLYNPLFIIVFFILVLLVFDGVNLFWDYQDVHMRQYVNFLLRMILLLNLVLVALVWFSGKAADVLVRPYLHLVFLISFISIITYILYIFVPMDYAYWEPLYLRKCEEGLRGCLYIHPYFLSLILHGESPIFFLGQRIVRSSGLSYEPAISAFFVVPGLFFGGYFIRRRWKKLFFLVTVFAFLLISSSVLSFMIFLILIMIYLIKRKHLIFFGAFFSLLSMVIAPRIERGADNFIFNKLVRVQTGSAGVTLSQHLDALSGGGQSAPILSFMRGVNSSPNLFFSTSFYSLVMLLLLVTAYTYFRSNRNLLLLMGLIYVQLHSLKSLAHSYTTVVIYFLIFVATLSAFRSEKSFSARKILLNKDGGTSN